MGKRKLSPRTAAKIDAWRARTRAREAMKIAAERERLSKLPPPK